MVEGGAAGCLATDDGGVDGYYIGGVDVAVAVDIAGVAGEAGGIAILDVGVDGYDVGGVDLAIAVGVALLAEYVRNEAHAVAIFALH